MKSWGTFFHLILLCLNVCAFCRQAPEKEEGGAELFLFEDLPTVISATLTPRTANLVPNAVDVLQAEEIGLYRMFGILDGLRTATGIETPYIQGRRHNVLIRGLGGQTGQGVLVLRDNQDITSPFDGGIALDGQIPITNAKQMEILRGPGSAIYGANAFAGVISVLSPDFSDQRTLKSEVMAGSHDTYRVGGFLNSSWLQLEAYGNKTNAYHTHSTTENDHLDTMSSYMRMKLNPSMTASLGLIREDRGLDFPGAEQGATWLEERESQYGKLDYERAWSQGRWRAKIGAFASRIEAEEQEVSGLKNNTEESRVGGFSHFFYQPNSFHTLTFGADFRQERAVSDSGPLEWESIGNIAAFVQDEFFPFPRLNATLGLRYDENSQYPDRFSPRIAFAYMLTPQAHVKMGYGEAFRAPTLSELYYDRQFSPQVSLQGNPDLDPEKLSNYELAIHWKKENLRFAVQYFHSEGRNLIVSRTERVDVPFGPPLFEVRYYNASTVDSEGVEGELIYLKRDGFRARLNYSYTETLDSETGGPIRDVAKNKGNLLLQLPLAGSWKPSVGALVHFRGSRTGFLANRQLGTIESYTLLDLMIGIQPSSLVDLRAVLHNVADVSYMSSELTFGAGRTFECSVILRY